MEKDKQDLPDATAIDCQRSGEELPKPSEIEVISSSLALQGGDCAIGLERTSLRDGFYQTGGSASPGSFSTYTHNCLQPVSSSHCTDEPQRYTRPGDSAQTEVKAGHSNNSSAHLGQYECKKVLQVKLHRLGSQYFVKEECRAQNCVNGGRKSAKKALQGRGSQVCLPGSGIKDEKSDFPGMNETLNLHTAHCEIDTPVKEEAQVGRDSDADHDSPLPYQTSQVSLRQRLAQRKGTGTDEGEEEESPRNGVIRERRMAPRMCKKKNYLEALSSEIDTDDERSDGKIKVNKKTMAKSKASHDHKLSSKVKRRRRAHELVKLRLKIKSSYAKYANKTCPICLTTFPGADSLAVHMRLHTDKRTDSENEVLGEKSNRTCPICKKTFSRADSLTCHMRVHTGDRPFKCKQCDAAYKVSSHLREHVRSKHSDTGRRLPSKKGNRTCPICQKVFARVDSLTCHMRVHTGDRPFQCKQCDAAYKVSSHLSDHVRSKHTDSRPFECAVCNKTFSYSSAKRRHEQNCGKDFTDRMMFKCAKCEKRFMTADGCKRHEKTCGVDKAGEDAMLPDDKEFTFKTRTTTGDREIGDFKCSLCPRHFIRKRCLSLHVMSVHCGMKPYKCNECDLAFACGEKLSRHIRRVHRNEKRFKCMLCSEGFFDSAAWMRHMQRHATQPDKQFRGRRRKELTCTFCNKSFPVISLRNHITNEHPEVSLSEALARELPQCHICSKTYFSRVGLRHHLKREHPDVKTEEKSTPMPKSPQPDRKPMSCPKCGRQFTNIQCYKAHLKLHWEVKPYICADCGKSYVDIVRLKVHMSKHDGPKPYMCEVCGAGFYYNHLLEQHMERKHTDLQKRQWLCAECGKILARKDQLYKHIKLHAKYPDGKIPTRGRRKGSKNAPKYPKHLMPDELPEERMQMKSETGNDYPNEWGKISVPPVSHMRQSMQPEPNTAPVTGFISPQDGFVDLTEAGSPSPVGPNFRSKSSLVPVSVTDFSQSEDFMGLAVAKHPASMESNLRTHYSTVPLISKPSEKNYMDFAMVPHTTPVDVNNLKTMSNAAAVSMSGLRPEERDFVNLTVARNPSSTEMFLKTSTNASAITVPDFRPAEDDFMDLTMVKSPAPMGLNLKTKTNTNFGHLTDIKHEEGFMDMSVSEPRANFGMFGMHNFQHPMNTYSSYIHDSILGLDRRNMEAGNRGIKN